MMVTSASGKKAIKVGNGGEGYKQLMHKHILPLVEHNAMGVVRTQMEPAEVNEVLRAFSGPLEKQFLAIAKRQSKILDPSKQPKGDGLHSSPPEVLVLNVEDFIKDNERQKLFVEMKALVLDPIRGTSSSHDSTRSAPTLKHRTASKPSMDARGRQAAPRRLVAVALCRV